MRTPLVMVLVVAGAVLTTIDAHAQSCGDANATGTITVTDGVLVLRRAADLPGSCDIRACDLDGSGTVTVTDGVNVLRAAAGLPATLACPNPDVTNFVDGVASGDGTDGTLDVGVAPIPGSGAPDTVTGVTGSNTAPADGQTDVTVSFDTQSQAAAAESAAGGGTTLIIAVITSGGVFQEGFFELPLATDTGQVQVILKWPHVFGASSFSLAFATVRAGVVSQYRTFAIRATHATTPTPRRTSTPKPTATPAPVCGNQVIEPPETCDPPCVPSALAGCSVNACRSDCTFCGDGIRNGNEQCDGTDNAQCQGVACDASCRCIIIG